MKMKVAAVQMVSGPDVEANLEVADRLLGQAAAQGAGLALLPEYFCLMGSHERDKLGIMEGEDGPLQRFLADAARRHGLVVVGGTVPLRSPRINRVYNSCLVHGTDGRRLARYDKIHLFGFRRGAERFDEAASIFPGRTPVVVDVRCRVDEAGVGRPVTGGADEGGDGAGPEGPEGPAVRCVRVGLSVCYDLRFPELYRQMAPLDLIVVPAAFTYTTGEAHWSLLLRARAVENQCFVLAAAQGGRHPSGRRTWGQSMVVDPWGTVLAEQAQGEGVVMAELDLARMAEVREGLPALKHRVV